jgi:two-component system, NarL family, sensor histidine kinase UhpB
MSQHPARAMYDQIEATLTSITMQLRSAIQADTDAATLATDAADRLRRPNGWARRVTTELGSVLIDTLGLAATIEWHLQQCRKCTGLDYELSVNNTSRVDLPEKFAATLFEIYSEALSNVARHAYASRVTVALAITPDAVTMAVADNGVGLGNWVSASTPGGLSVMRERCRAYNGLCTVTTARGAGTTVIVSLPFAASP